jgi:PAS domain S-box-containing protein
MPLTKDITSLTQVGMPHSSYDAVICLNLNGDIISWNPPAERTYGFKAEEIIGKNISLIIPEEILETEKVLLRKVAENVEIGNYETTRKTKSGEMIVVTINLSPTKDERGTITGISKITMDINKQKNAVEKQFMLAAIVNSSDDAIIGKTLEGIITSWNSGAVKMFGFTEQEAIGSHISIIIPKERIEEEMVIIENIKKGEKIDHAETVRCAKDGRKINVSLTVWPIKNAKGEIIGASKMIRDVTEKKFSEEKQSILASIVSSSDDAIISKTLDGIITSWNHAAEKMFGHTEEEAIGKSITIIIPPERIQEEAVIIDNIRNGRKIDHFETVRMAKDGRRINISLTVSPLKNVKGEIIGASKVARDITDKIEAEKKQRLYTQQLQDLNTYKDEFMAMASHELKTPLTVISVNLQILKLKMGNDANIAFVEKTEKQVSKFTELINNLLSVSKINLGKLELQPEKFNINIFLKEVLNDLQQTTTQHTIIYKEESKALIVNADKQKVGQVILNIISNSIKYSPGGGEIVVEIKKIKDNIEIICSDNGIGIPKKDLENIFTRFYRVSGLASSFSGSGIGLYISSEIIKRHGGKIWVKSKPGKGSQFHFTLPAISS